MRIFRGKDSKTWRYGNIVQITDEKGIKYYILWEKLSPPIRRFKAEVKEETIGQCIDMIDKNKKLIFEGDIIKVTFTDSKGETKINRLIVDKFNNWEIIGRIELANEVEVIGNTIDNPELTIEVKNKEKKE